MCISVTGVSKYCGYSAFQFGVVSAFQADLVKSG
jgi:hypothetical protein